MCFWEEDRVLELSFLPSQSLGLQTFQACCNDHLFSQTFNVSVITQKCCGKKKDLDEGL